MDDDGVAAVSPIRGRQRQANRARRFDVGMIVIALSMVGIACTGPAGPSPTQSTSGDVVVSPSELVEDEVDLTIDHEAALAEPSDALDPRPLADFVWFDGRAGSTTDFLGQPTVMNFWQSTCAPCVAEMPEFEEVFQALDGSVAFVGMNVADARDAADELAEVTGVTYPLAADPDSEVFRSFGGFVMPTTVFLNAQGQVAFVWSGVLTSDELRTLIDRHILPGSLDDT